MALSQSQILSFAKPKLSKSIGNFALKDSFGLGNCASDFNKALSLYLITDMFDCTNGDDLTQVEKDCLLGKLQEPFTLNCN